MVGKKSLNRLYEVFTVEDLMTDLRQLKRADNYNDAKNLFNEYDVVPYPKKGKIKGYFNHNSEGINPIRSNVLVSHKTSIFDLFGLLSQNQFFFVLSGNEIVGYIHFSDLNKPFTKISLFAIFEAVERRFWEQFKNRVNEDGIRNVFGKKEFDRFFKKKAFNIKRNVDIGWTGVFTFPYILRLARYYGLTDLTDQDVKLLKETRNKLAHSDRNLVNSYKDAKRLNEAEKICRSLIE